MSIPSVSKTVFQIYLTLYGLDYTASSLPSLGTADYFLLGRLAINLKGSTMDEVLNKLMRRGSSEQGISLVNRANGKSSEED